VPAPASRREAAADVKIGAIGDVELARGNHIREVRRIFINTVDASALAA